MSKRKAADTLSSNGLVQFINLLDQDAKLGITVMEAFHSEMDVTAASAHLRQLHELALRHQFSKIEVLRQSEEGEDEGDPLMADLYDLYLLHQFLSWISWTPLLMLASSVLEACGEDVIARATALQSTAATLRKWDTAKLQDAELRIKSTPAHQETNEVLAMDDVDTFGVLALGELLKLMPQDTAALRECLCRSSDRQIHVVVQVLTKMGMFDQSLFALKTLVDSPLVPVASAASALAGMVQATKSTASGSTSSGSSSTAHNGSTPTLVHNKIAAPAVPRPDQALAANPGGLQLRFTKECNRATVYHKILKPFPTLEVVGNGDTSNLHVQAELFRHDGPNKPITERLPYLEGEHTVAVSGNVAIFRKLKISLTSTSIGSPFVLRFSLMRMEQKVLVPMGVYAMIGPIEVYSHTSYLKTDKVKSEKKKRRKSPEWEGSDSDE